MKRSRIRTNSLNLLDPCCVLMKYLAEIQLRDLIVTTHPLTEFYLNLHGVQLQF